jgi:hypothetical protein
MIEAGNEATLSITVELAYGPTWYTRDGWSYAGAKPRLRPPPSPVAQGLENTGKVNAMLRTAVSSSY